MRPPVSSTCDACFKPLDQPLVCARCKGLAYCSKACQTQGWHNSHRGGCSKLRTERTVPFEIADLGGAERAVREVSGLIGRLVEVMRAFDAYEVFDLAGSIQIGQSKVALIDYKFAPAFAPHFAITPRLVNPSPALLDERKLDINLAGFSRLYLMYDAATLTAAQRAPFLHAFADPAALSRDMIRLDPDEAVVAWSQLTTSKALHARAAMRVFGPKLLTQPDALSVAEYETVWPQMYAFWRLEGERTVGAGRVAALSRAKRWEELGSIMELHFKTGTGPRVGGRVT